MSIEIVPASEFVQGKEGFFAGLPEPVYRRAPGVNISSLKKALVSPLHYQVALESPHEASRSMELGTIIHTAILEPEKLSSAMVVRPEWITDFRSTKAKEWREKQTVPDVSAEEAAGICCIRDSMKADPFVSTILQNASIEVSGFACDKQTGCLAKARADAVVQDGDGVWWGFDVKTVQAGYAGDRFANAAADFDYHLQCAWYMDLFKLNRFVFITVERELPFDWTMWELEDSDIELARRVNRRLLDELAQAHESGVYPGMPKNLIRKLRLPSWKHKQHEEYA